MDTGLTGSAHQWFLQVRELLSFWKAEKQNLTSKMHLYNNICSRPDLCTTAKVMPDRYLVHFFSSLLVPLILVINPRLMQMSMNRIRQRVFKV